MKNVQRYDIAAPIYDWFAWVLSLGGISKLHPALVEGLDMTDKTVIDLGCGTGLAFEGLLNSVGPNGEIIGIDNNASILAKADNRIAANNWTNVTTKIADIATLDTAGADIVISCIAMSCVPDPTRELDGLLQNLKPGVVVRIIDALPRAEGNFRSSFFNRYNQMKAHIVGSHYQQLEGFAKVFQENLSEVRVDALHGGMYTRLTGVKVP